jgi:hypothetical protein
VRRSFVLRWFAALVGLAVLTGALSGCLSALIPDAASTDEWDEFVTVTFALESEFGDDELLEQMWPIEEQAIEALESAGLGTIDGDDVGGHEYSLWFYGADREAMWDVLEPIMRTAPLPLSRVALWPAGDDTEPEVIELAE